MVEDSLNEGVASPNYEVACFIMENCPDCLCWHGAIHIYRFKQWLRDEKIKRGYKMNNRVFTKSTCDICGVENIRDGTRDYPPVGWWALNFACTDEDAWFKYSSIEKTICPECAVPILNILKKKGVK